MQDLVLTTSPNKTGRPEGSKSHAPRCNAVCGGKKCDTKTSEESPFSASCDIPAHVENVRTVPEGFISADGYIQLLVNDEWARAAAERKALQTAKQTAYKLELSQTKLRLAGQTVTAVRNQLAVTAVSATNLQQQALETANAALVTNGLVQTAVDLTSRMMDAADEYMQAEGTYLCVIYH